MTFIPWNFFSHGFFATCEKCGFMKCHKIGLLTHMILLLGRPVHYDIDCESGRCPHCGGKMKVIKF